MFVNGIGSSGMYQIYKLNSLNLNIICSEQPWNYGLNLYVCNTNLLIW